jgi:hypothetical protein
MEPRDLTHRRRILFTMLTALSYRYPSGRSPALIPALRRGAPASPATGVDGSHPLSTTDPGGYSFTTDGAALAGVLRAHVLRWDALPRKSWPD